MHTLIASLESILVTAAFAEHDILHDDEASCASRTVAECRDREKAWCA